MKAIIIEDEKRTATNLQKMLKNVLPAIDLITILGSVEESVLWFKNNNMPDLIFMDIQLSDGISFEIFNEVQIDAPIIFTTSYDEYAIKAFEVNGIDYLLKPVDEVKLQKSIQKFLKIQGNNNVLHDISQLMKHFKIEQNKFKTRFLVKSGQSFLSVSVEDISYFIIDNELNFLISKSSKRYIIDYTMEELENQLNPKYFFRLNRQCIANIDAIEGVHSYFNHTLKIDLKPATDKEIIVSRYNNKDFKAWLDR